MNTALPVVALPSGRFKGLQPSLVLFVVLPLTLVSALGIRFGLDRASAFQEDRMEKDIELIARAIGIPVGTALVAGDREAVGLALQSVFAIGRVYGASVFDVDGEPVASAGTTESDLTGSAIPGQIAATGEQQGAYREVDGRDVFSHFSPVFGTGGQIEGLIQINRRASDFEAALGQFTIIAWAVWGGFTLVIVITVLLGHYGGVGRHVDRLLAHMKRIESGDRLHRAAVVGPAEVCAMAEGLNRMLDGIEAAEREVASHREAEQHLVARLKDNERMAAIGRMARGIAHELAAPLSVIDGRVRRLYRENLLGAESRRHLDGIRAQVSRLTGTVRQLLDYCRPEISNPNETVQVGQLMRAVVDAIRPEIQAAGLDLGLHTAGSPPVVTGDLRRLELALLNIVRNALQAAEHTVDISLGQEENSLLIQVSDDGPGLPPGPPAQFLEPFFSTKPPGEGTGLGLAIAHSAVTEHGGTLALGNRPGGGCRVRVLLPLAEGAAAPSRGQS